MHSKLIFLHIACRYLAVTQRDSVSKQRQADKNCDLKMHKHRTKQHSKEDMMFILQTTNIILEEEEVVIMWIV